MSKIPFLAISLATLVGCSAALAQSTQDRMPAKDATAETSAIGCNAAVISAEPRVNGITDPQRKQEAMMELNMAKSSMAANDEMGCMTRMQTLQRSLSADSVGRPGQGSEPR